MPYETSSDVAKGLRAAQPSPPSHPPHPPNAPRERLPRALPDPSVTKPSLRPCIYSPDIPRAAASSGHEMLMAKGKAVKQWGCQVRPAVGAFFYRDISNGRVTTRQHSKWVDGLSAGSDGLTRDHHSFQPLVCDHHIKWPMWTHGSSPGFPKAIHCTPPQQQLHQHQWQDSAGEREGKETKRPEI